ncbi:MAG: hypothetical protein CMF48_00235 [Legionellales bacterium]|nr:hypothetical protein [Legionellales bacterium]
MLRFLARLKTTASEPTSRSLSSSNPSVACPYLRSMNERVAALHIELCQLGKDHPYISDHPLYTRLTGQTSPRYPSKHSEPTNKHKDFQEVCSQMDIFIHACKTARIQGTRFPQQSDRLADALTEVFNEHCRPQMTRPGSR